MKVEIREFTHSDLIITSTPLQFPEQYMLQWNSIYTFYGHNANPLKGAVQ
jgi:hypothetical protein